MAHSSCRFGTAYVPTRAGYRQVANLGEVKVQKIFTVRPIAADVGGVGGVGVAVELLDVKVSETWTL